MATGPEVVAVLDAELHRPGGSVRQYRDALIREGHLPSNQGAPREHTLHEIAKVLVAVMIGPAARRKPGLVIGYMDLRPLDGGPLVLGWEIASFLDEPEGMVALSIGVDRLVSTLKVRGAAGGVRERVFAPAGICDQATGLQRYSVIGEDSWAQLAAALKDPPPLAPRRNPMRRFSQAAHSPMRYFP